MNETVSRHPRHAPLPGRAIRSIPRNGLDSYGATDASDFVCSDDGTPGLSAFGRVKQAATVAATATFPSTVPAFAGHAPAGDAVSTGGPAATTAAYERAAGWLMSMTYKRTAVYLVGVVYLLCLFGS